MPQTKSAKKRMRQNEKLREANRQVKSRMKTAIRRVVEAASKKAPPEELRDLVSQAFRHIDKAAKKNIVHKNNAARKKSKLARLTGQSKSV
jgi:small subunit ribosomal protein S20